VGMAGGTPEPEGKTDGGMSEKEKRMEEGVSVGWSLNDPMQQKRQNRVL